MVHVVLERAAASDALLPTARADRIHLRRFWIWAVIPVVAPHPQIAGNVINPEFVGLELSDRVRVLILCVAVAPRGVRGEILIRIAVTEKPSGCRSRALDKFIFGWPNSRLTSYRLGPRGHARATAGQLATEERAHLDTVLDCADASRRYRLLESRLNPQAGKPALPAHPVTTPDFGLNELLKDYQKPSIHFA